MCGDEQDGGGDMCGIVGNVVLNTTTIDKVGRHKMPGNGQRKMKKYQMRLKNVN